MMDQFDGIRRPRSINVGDNDQPSILNVPLLEAYTDLDAQLLGGPSSTGESFALYNCAFSKDDIPWSPRMNTSTLTAILLYNSGLSHTIMAIQGPSDRPKKLHDALRCYKYSLKIIQQYQHPHFYVMTLGLLNNMGFIFSCLSWFNEAQSCRERLDVLLENSSPEILSDDDADFFYFGYGCGFPTAAPAA
jgi:hypothetical protein